MFQQSPRATRRHALAILCFAALATMPQAAEAAKRKASCVASKTSVTGWGCVSRKEVAKAKKICLGLSPPEQDFRQCLCRDGTMVGACGD